ncbi:MAG: hypothetical protein ACTH5M_01075 [Psychrobacter sp.]
MEKSASQGNHDAQYMLGMMYYLGQGVPKLHSGLKNLLYESTKLRVCPN